MIVLLNELSQQPVQVRLAQHDHVIKQLASQRADEPFQKRILPRTPVGYPNLSDAAGIQECSHTITVDAVVIAEEIPRLLTKRHRFPELLDHPVHGGTVCRPEVNKTSAAVVENQEDVQRIESQRSDCEEINRPGHIQVIPEKGQPSR